MFGHELSTCSGSTTGCTWMSSFRWWIWLFIGDETASPWKTSSCRNAAWGSTLHCCLVTWNEQMKRKTLFPWMGQLWCFLAMCSCLAVADFSFNCIYRPCSSFDHRWLLFLAFTLIDQPSAVCTDFSFANDHNAAMLCDFKVVTTQSHLHRRIFWSWHGIVGKLGWQDCCPGQMRLSRPKQTLNQWVSRTEKWINNFRIPALHEDQLHRTWLLEFWSINRVAEQSQGMTDKWTGQKDWRNSCSMKSLLKLEFDVDLSNVSVLLDQCTVPLPGFLFFVLFCC